MRIILFTGKGGVGKTTCAAATALRIAQEGKKTLIISTDPAHSLSDALGQQLGPEPTAVSENLWGQELDVYYSMQKHWGNMRQLMLSIFKWRGVDNIVAEELSVLPGMEEASAFLWIEQYYRKKSYDVLIIDSAPTGETLTLLTLPQVMQSWLTKAFPGQRLAIKAVGSLLRRTKGIPLDKGYEELQALFGKLEEVQAIMLNPDICSIRIVANPERMVVQEAKRAYMYLQLYGYQVDALLINRVIPDLPELQEGFWQEYLSAQIGHIRDIEESFAPLPIFKLQHRGREVFGLALLEQLAEELYGEQKASGILYKQKNFDIEEIGKFYVLRIQLPFLQEQDYKLRKMGEELILDIGNRRKHIQLPRFAQFLELQDYDYGQGCLRVRLLKKN